MLYPGDWNCSKRISTVKRNIWISNAFFAGECAEKGRKDECTLCGRQDCANSGKTDARTNSEKNPFSMLRK